MKKYLIFFFLFLFLFLNQGWAVLKKNDIAPDFSLTGTDGKILYLSQIKCKVTLIEFISKKCFACDMVIPDINKLYEKYRNKNVQIIGVLFNDEVEDILKLKEFIVSREIKFPVFIADVKVKKNYSVFGFPNFFILNEKKQITQIYRGITKDTFGLLNKEIEKILNERH